MLYLLYDPIFEDADEQWGLFDSSLPAVVWSSSLEEAIEDAPTTPQQPFIKKDITSIKAFLLQETNADYDCDPKVIAKGPTMPALMKAYPELFV